MGKFEDRILFWNRRIQNRGEGTLGRCGFAPWGFALRGGVFRGRACGDGGDLGFGGDNSGEAIALELALERSQFFFQDFEQFVAIVE